MRRDERARLLWGLWALFVLRVVGQILVGLVEPQWLPPWHEWYSGRVPYPALLPVQIVLITLMAIVNRHNLAGHGHFHVRSTSVRRWIRAISAIYAVSMLVRYATTMVLAPEMRWFHGTIPIAFHLVLAAYLWILGVRPADERDQSVLSA